MRRVRIASRRRSVGAIDEVGSTTDAVGNHARLPGPRVPGRRRVAGLVRLRAPAARCASTGELATALGNRALNVLQRSTLSVYRGLRSSRTSRIACTAYADTCPRPSTPSSCATSRSSPRSTRTPECGRRAPHASCLPC